MTFTFYFGAASGQSRAALRKLEESQVMLNYASSGSEPWEGIDRLFIDSGGYSFMKGKGEYETTADEYLDFIERVEPELYALRDYPCEPDVLDEHGRTIEDHQRMTTEAHVRLWDRLEDRELCPPAGPQPVSVVQGRSVDEYLSHLDSLRDHGVLADYVGIGSVCGRENIGEIRRIVLALRDALPESTDLHGFGVKRTALLKHDRVVNALSSADSQAYARTGRWQSLKANRPHTWIEVAYQYLRFKRRILGISAEDPEPADLRHPDTVGLDEFARADGGQSPLKTEDERA